MKQLGIVLVFGLGVGVGCAAGTAVQTQVAEAQAPAGVTRWEYKCELIRSNNKREATMNELGPDGWEAFVVDGIEVCFKRPLP